MHGSVLEMKLNDTYSYKSLLEKTLKEFKPKIILEWGSGKSTKLMRKLLPDSEIHSIEHQLKWYLLWKLTIHKVNLHRIPLNNYPSPNFPDKYFDFIFVDGRNRVECMKSSLELLKDNGLLMLHDSNREKYREGIKLFKIITEENNTMLMRK